jgi:FkbM family methyltransferase
MSFISTARKAANILISPWLYMAFRTSRRPGFRTAALKCDPYNARAVADGVQSGVHTYVVHKLLQAFMLAGRISGPRVSLIMENIEKSTSQFMLLQDLFVLMVLGGQRNGYFVEVGVGDGRYLSNTYLLEKEFGFSGLLLEPNRAFHESIRANRTAYLDERAAFSQSDRVLTFVANERMGELSKLADANDMETDARKGLAYEVRTVTLQDALAAQNAPSIIDYVSIDTEGSEEEVLRGLNLADRRVKVFTIEHNGEEQRRRRFAHILQPHGYVRILSDLSLVDDWYVHETLCRDFLALLR